MPNVYYNPYCGWIPDIESGKIRLLATASAYKCLCESDEFKAFDPEGSDSFRCVAVTIDDKGAKYTAASMLRYFSGRNKDLALWFCRQFDKGLRVTKEELASFEQWNLYGLGAPAPVLEYAVRKDGMTITISDQKLWCTNFFLFSDNNNAMIRHALLPNIHGQDDLGPIINWLSKWQLRNSGLKSLLETKYGVLFCSGSTNFCFPTGDEVDGLLTAFSRAKVSGYSTAASTVESFGTKFGAILELRSYGDGVRVFFVLKDERPVIGGFYRKSAALNQSKAGEKAAKRLKDSGYV
jgi:hypothetical protein